MHIQKFQGTEPELFILIGPLVMNPAIIRQNNNYPFKTGHNYEWYLAMDDGQVAGFIPLKRSGSTLLLDNYYIRGDEASTLGLLLKAVTQDLAADRDALFAVVHSRHVKEFTQHHFITCTEFKRYNKMQFIAPDAP